MFNHFTVIDKAQKDNHHRQNLREKTIHLARWMLKQKKFPPSNISQVTGLSFQELKDL